MADSISLFALLSTNRIKKETKLCKCGKDVEMCNPWQHHPAALKTR